jgi:hypothetical protein
LVKPVTLVPISSGIPLAIIYKVFVRPSYLLWQYCASLQLAVSCLILHPLVAWMLGLDSGCRLWSVIQHFLRYEKNKEGELCLKLKSETVKKKFCMLTLFL